MSKPVATYGRSLHFSSFTSSCQETAQLDCFLTASWTCSITSLGMLFVFHVFVITKKVSVSIHSNTIFCLTTYYISMSFHSTCVIAVHPLSWQLNTRYSEEPIELVLSIFYWASYWIVIKSPWEMLQIYNISTFRLRKASWCPRRPHDQENPEWETQWASDAAVQMIGSL